MNIALLLSGGTGTRLGKDIPKQYIRVGSFMIITYALRPLLASGHIDAVAIVAGEGYRDEITADINRLRNKETGSDGAITNGLPENETGNMSENEKLSFDDISGVGSLYDDLIDKLVVFADPGKNRQLSILSGMEKALELLPEGARLSVAEKDERKGDGDRKQNTVFIHDAARPLLKEALIDDCYKALPGHDGVMPVLPMKDTVYLSGNGRSVEQLLPRDRVFAGQAPELFLLEPYYSATKKLLPDEIMKIVGSTQVAIGAGMDIAMIPGDEGNFKITTMPDLERFAGIITG